MIHCHDCKNFFIYVSFKKRANWTDFKNLQKNNIEQNIQKRFLVTREQTWLKPTIGTIEKVVKYAQN